MKCVICKTETKPDIITVTLLDLEITVLKGAPAEVCETCMRTT